MTTPKVKKFALFSIKKTCSAEGKHLTRRHTKDVCPLGTCRTKTPHTKGVFVRHVPKGQTSKMCVSSPYVDVSVLNNIKLKTIPIYEFTYL